MSRPIYRPIHRLSRHLCGAAALLLALGACALSPAPPAAAEPAASPAQLQQQIEAEIGDAACSSDAQCHSLALGAKACGGPLRYLAWSSQRSDAARLQALADQLRRADEAGNAQQGRISDCRLVTDPGARCVAGRCQLGSSGSDALAR